MSGNRAGGLLAAKKNLARDPYFYKKAGKIGGLVPTPNGGFASNKVGKDGLTGRQRAIIKGRLGGQVSKRRPRETK